MKSRVSVWKDLVISMLAVYQYSLEKVDGFAQELEKQGLFDPKKLHQFSHEDIFTRLEKSGYIRGDLNAIFTNRLMDLGRYIQSEGIEKSEKILESNHKNEIASFLIKIKGVGPKVIENYFMLRDI